MWAIHSIKNEWIIWGKEGFRRLTNQQWDLRFLGGRSCLTPWLVQGFQVQKWSRCGPLSKNCWRFLIDFGPAGGPKMEMEMGFLRAIKMVTLKTPSMIPFEVAVSITSVTHQVVGIQTTRCSRSFDRSGSRAGSRQRWDSSARCRRLPGLGPWFLVGHTLILETEHVFVYVCCRPTMGIVTDVEIGFKQKMPLSHHPNATVSPGGAKHCGCFTSSMH